MVVFLSRIAGPNQGVFAEIEILAIATIRKTILIKPSVLDQKIPNLDFIVSKGIGREEVIDR